FHAVARKINAINNLCAILCRRLLDGSLECNRQSASIFRTNRSPQPRREQISETGARRVALVLSTPKTSSCCAQGIRGIVTKKKPAGDGQVRRTHHIGIANESAQISEVRSLDLSFRAINRGFAECNRKTHSGVKKLIVVGKIPCISPKVFGIEFYAPRKSLGE